MFVAHISDNALTAVSIVFPFQLLMIALATGSGVGINIVVSSFLGKQDPARAGKAAKNSLILGCINFAVVGISGFFLADAFVGIQTNIFSIFHDSVAYMKIVAGASFGYFLSIVYERLLQFTTDAVAVYGICSKLQNFVFMPVYGWGNGMVPAFAYHRSAGSKDRMQAIAKVSITVVLGITLCGTAVCSLLTPQLLHLFDASDTMLQVGIPALRIVSLSFPFAGFCVIANSIFQAFGKGFYSIVLTMIRQFVIWIPCAYCIGKWLQLDGIW